MTPRTRQIEIIGCPVDLGAGRRGVDMGPSAIRVADLERHLEALGHTVTDFGDIDVMIPETLTEESSTLRYKSAILRACDELRVEVERSLAGGQTPVILGGDHSLGIGSVSGASNHFHRRGESIGLIWFDAHGDFNTPETTPSGNVHGMSLAVLHGRGDRDLASLGGRAPKMQPRHTVLLGVRDLDPQERDLLRGSGITVFTIREIDERGMRDVVREALGIAGAGTAGIHLSFDLDVVDPEDAPGTGTPVDGGISYREAHLAMEMIGDLAEIVSVDLVELNPLLDQRNATGVLAVELIESLFGKRIL
jgi:arginase